MLDPANNDFNQLQVKTADGNDGNVMSRLGCQAFIWLAFIGSGLLDFGFWIADFGLKVIRVFGVSCLVIGL